MKITYDHHPLVQGKWFAKGCLFVVNESLEETEVSVSLGNGKSRKLYQGPSIAIDEIIRRWPEGSDIALPRLKVKK